MALQGKVETEVEIKVPADKFYNIWSKQAHHVPTASPNNVEAVHVHEGDWETEGSIKVWKYNIDGRPEEVKEKVVLNDEDKSVTMIGLEGHAMQEYKTINVVLHANPKGEGSSLVKVRIEYEKIKEDIPTPNNYLNFFVNLTKDIEAHHLKG
ncbi:MLP-like protein 28 [Quillaja saponaria]|uniref:MLP-like protein 28 n=1 Tax=Quillaja saponaria TaxID=32244 RepID=A0AAD7KNZ6_QUISA|nr:MLP-like protein 28 [Quillaja saponaria]